MTLEEQLHAAVAKGLTHLTLYPVASEDKKTTYWHAKATPSSGHAYVQITTTDPAQALMQVLLALPKAARRVIKKSGPTCEVTATVSDAMPANYTEADHPVGETQEDIETWLPKA